MAIGGILDRQYSSFVQSPTRPEGNAAREVTVGNYDQLEENKSKTSFDELKVTQRFTQIELTSAVASVSKIRNVVRENLAGTVTAGDTGEYLLRTTAQANDLAVIESGERGVYIPGYDAEVGIGIRLNDLAYTGTACAEWGYTNTVSGLGFGYDVDGFYIFRKTDSVKEKIYQENFNSDKVDGTGPSGQILDLLKGNIFQVEFSWYGYGVIRFVALIKDVNFVKGMRPITVHKLIVENSVSIENPNLPIEITLDNGDAAEAHDLYLGGRQFSIFGVAPNVFRINGNYRQDITLSTSVWTPVVSLRRKSGIFSNQNVKINKVEAIASDNIVVAFVTGGTLTGATFGNLRDIDPDETSLESDISATAITGGTFFAGYHIIRGGTGASRGTVSETIKKIAFSFIGENTVTVVAKALNANTDINLLIFDAEEEW